MYYVLANVVPILVNVLVRQVSRWISKQHWEVRDKTKVEYILSRLIKTKTFRVERKGSLLFFFLFYDKRDLEDTVRVSREGGCIMSLTLSFNDCCEYLVSVLIFFVPRPPIEFFYCSGFFLSRGMLKGSPLAKYSWLFSEGSATNKRKMNAARFFFSFKPSYFFLRVCKVYVGCFSFNFVWALWSEDSYGKKSKTKKISWHK